MGDGATGGRGRIRGVPDTGSRAAHRTAVETVRHAGARGPRGVPDGAGATGLREPAGRARLGGTSPTTSGKPSASRVRISPHHAIGICFGCGTSPYLARMRGPGDIAIGLAVPRAGGSGAPRGSPRNYPAPSSTTIDERIARKRSLRPGPSHINHVMQRACRITSVPPARSRVSRPAEMGARSPTTTRLRKRPGRANPTCAS